MKSSTASRFALLANLQPIRITQRHETQLNHRRNAATRDNSRASDPTAPANGESGSSRNVPVRRPSLKTYWTICVRHAVAPFWCVEILGTAVQRRRCSAATSRSRYPCKRSSSFASAHTIQRCHPPLSWRARTKPCSIQESRRLREVPSWLANSRAHHSSGPSTAREEPCPCVFPRPSWCRSVCTLATLQSCLLRSAGKPSVSSWWAIASRDQPAWVKSCTRVQRRPESPLSR